MGIEGYADWNGDGLFDGPHEEITQYLSAAAGLICSRGKDHGLEGAAPIAGQLTTELLNDSRILSFGNASSPLFENLAPGRDVKIELTAMPGAAFGLYGGGTLGLYGGGSLGLYGSDKLTIWTGPIDDIVQNPEGRNVALICFGPFSRLVGNVISTGLHQGIRTDEALHLLLDAAGWPEDKRDIQEGLTVFDNWWLKNEDAFSAMLRILASEGTGASVYESRLGWFIFENRISRTVMARSTMPQYTYRDDELPMQPPLTPRANYKQVVLAASVEIVERAASPLAEVWKHDSDLVLAANESRTFTIEGGGDPFLNALVPTDTASNTIWVFTGSHPLTSGTFKGEYLGQTIAGTLAFNATAADFQAAFEPLSTIGMDNILFSGGPLNVAPIFGELIGAFEGVNVTTIPTILASTLNPVSIPGAIVPTEIVPGSSVLPERQLLTPAGVLTGGTYTIGVVWSSGSALTASIDYDATDADIQAAIVASDPALSNTFCGGGPQNLNPVQIILVDLMENIDLVEITTTGLTMQTPGATVEVAVSQPGGMPDFVPVSGSVIFTLGRDNGPDLPLTAEAGVAGATVKGLRLRAQTLAVVRREKVTYPENTTVPDWKIFRPSNVSPEISKATMLEILAALVTRYNVPRLTYLLTSKRGLYESGVSIEAAQEISNRIGIKDSQTGVEADFFIDSITHAIPAQTLEFVSQYECELAD